MKKVLIQLGKAICYFMLFFGVQLLVCIAMMFVYGMKIGMETAITGTMPSTVEMVEGMTDFLMNNMLWPAWISGVLTLFALWLFFIIRKKNVFQEISLCKFDKNKVIPLIFLGVATSFFISCALSLLPLPESMLESYAESSQGLTSGSLFIRVLATIIVAPVVEEVVFRGLILSRLKKAMNIWVAIVISSLAFGLMHGQLLWIAYAFVTGMLFAVVAERLKSIGASIIIHMSFNLVGIFGEQITLPDVWMIVLIVASFVITAGSIYYIMKKA